MEKEEILEKLKEVILSWDLPFSEGEIYEDVRLREDLMFDAGDILLLALELENVTGISLPNDSDWALPYDEGEWKTIGDVVDSFWRATMI